MAKSKNRRKKHQPRRYSPSALTHHVAKVSRVPAPEGIDPSADWYVVCTNIRCERRAQLGLDQKGYKTFLPQLRKEVKSGRQTKEVTRPLFPRYLLVSIGDKPWYPIRHVDGVLSIIRNENGPIRVPTRFVEELVHLHNEAGLDLPENVAEPMPAPGESVTIKDGPFANLIATIEAVLPSGRAKILVDIFGRATEMEVDASQLRAA